MSEPLFRNYQLKQHPYQPSEQSDSTENINFEKRVNVKEFN